MFDPYPYRLTRTLRVSFFRVAGVFIAAHGRDDLRDIYRNLTDSVLLDSEITEVPCIDVSRLDLRAADTGKICRQVMDLKAAVLAAREAQLKAAQVQAFWCLYPLPAPLGLTVQYDCDGEIPSLMLGERSVYYIGEDARQAKFVNSVKKGLPFKFREPIPVGDYHSGDIVRRGTQLWLLLRYQPEQSTYVALRLPDPLPQAATESVNLGKEPMEHLRAEEILPYAYAPRQVASNEPAAASACQDG